MFAKYYNSDLTPEQFFDVIYTEYSESELTQQKKRDCVKEMNRLREEMKTKPDFDRIRYKISDLCSTFDALELRSHYHEKKEIRYVIHLIQRWNLKRTRTVEPTVDLYYDCTENDLLR